MDIHHSMQASLPSVDSRWTQPHLRTWPKDGFQERADLFIAPQIDRKSVVCPKGRGGSTPPPSRTQNGGPFKRSVTVSLYRVPPIPDRAEAD
jgi:hypothetical protein